ncbi:type II toxin-antitoxin system VapB family antitoxin [Neorhizobium sp. NCHU2750]|uniref:type II toxin-antitoxin system VapB family antitoxin n=1 Tax=Neorhizobium sp. NCHU2750 TaxID=1825976 RepID=UPI000E729AEB|nr:hypothetical protein NCHU2750_10310 [Neorhizobium sp. NCHU2750]
MALDLTNEELDALAERARKVLNAPTKQDAVRQALERVVGEPSKEAEQAENRATRADRLQALQREYQSMGSFNPDFNEKKFLDDMWGN